MAQGDTVAAPSASGGHDPLASLFAPDTSEEYLEAPSEQSPPTLTPPPRPTPPLRPPVELPKRLALPPPIEEVMGSESDTTAPLPKQNVCSQLSKACCVPSCLKNCLQNIWDQLDNDELSKQQLLGDPDLVACGPFSSEVEGLGPLLPENARMPTPLIPPRRLEDDGKLCVVLDLDETLVQNRSREMIERPHLHKLLDVLRGQCEVILWTASNDEVARTAADHLDPKREVFTHIISRNPTWFHGESIAYTKDLTLLGRDLRRTVIVENTARCVRLQPENAIMVPDWWGDFDSETGALADVAMVMQNLIHNPEYPVSTLLRESPYLTERRTVWGMWLLGLEMSKGLRYALGNASLDEYGSDAHLF